jgi:DNA-binding transcriptional regulator WhiA
MEKVVLIQFLVQGIDQKLPLHIVSKNEPNKNQILEKIMELVNHYDLSTEVHYEKFLQEKSQKVYVYKIGDKSCVVIVERIEVMEFQK